MPKFLKLVISIVICESAGVIGSFFTVPSIPTWYAALQKPEFSPPNFVFGPVWTTLYLLMGISLFLVWKSKGGRDNKGKAMQVFFTQLILNVLWSIVFFGFHSLAGGLVVIVFLWLLIIETIREFSKINKIAAILLYPYLAWVTFASFLNLALVFLNR